MQILCRTIGPYKVKKVNERTPTILITEMAWPSIAISNTTPIESGFFDSQE
jgi:hypothetical protein